MTSYLEAPQRNWDETERKGKGAERGSAWHLFSEETGGRAEGRTHAEKKSRSSQFRGRSEVANSVVSFGTRNSICGNTDSRKSADSQTGLGTVPEIKPRHMSSSIPESSYSSSPLNKDIRNERLFPP